MPHEHADNRWSPRGRRHRTPEAETDLSDERRKAIQRGRNRAVGLILAGLAVLFFAITIVKIKH